MSDAYTFDWFDDALSFGEHGWNMSHSLDETLRYAREYGCPKRHIGRVADGWYRAREHARNEVA